MNIELQKMNDTKTEWTRIKRQVEGVYEPQDLETRRNQVRMSIVDYSRELSEFFGDRDTAEFRRMSAKLEEIAVEAGAVGLNGPIVKLRKILQQRGIPLLEKLYRVMTAEIEVICCLLTDPIRVLFFKLSRRDI